MNTRYRLMGCTSFALIATLTGCGGGLSREDVSDTTSRLANIEITRNAQKASPDCPVTVTIGNRTRIAWDGVSYHVAMHNRNGVSIGKLLGSPRKPIASGKELIVQDTILGAKCDQVTGAALVYFGYYPAGKKQVTVHNVNVQLRLK